MQYSEIQTLFVGLLNRKDITTSLITSFLNLGAQYVTRKLRIPPMEKLIQYTSDGTGLIGIPVDFLEIIALYTNDTNGVNKLTKADLQTTLRSAMYPGSPQYYCRSGNFFHAAPLPASGVVVNLTYYGDGTGLSADTDHNWMSDACPAAWVYAALKYAADYYTDDRKVSFLTTLAEEMQTIQDMADRDELTNASMLPAYPDVD